jgi:hypothetical protein
MFDSNTYICPLRVPHTTQSSWADSWLSAKATSFLLAQPEILSPIWDGAVWNLWQVQMALSRVPGLHVSFSGEELPSIPLGRELPAVLPAPLHPEETMSLC